MRRELRMARMDRRLKLWGWVTRRQVSVARMTEAEVVALQGRHVPSNVVIDWICGAVAQGIEVSNRSLPGPGGDIPIRVYRPAGATSGTGSAARPLVVYFHGGGFVFGELRLGDWLCGQVAAKVGAVVVSVDYRLAPAHRFPAAVEDCYAGGGGGGGERGQTRAAGGRA